MNTILFITYFHFFSTLIKIIFLLMVLYFLYFLIKEIIDFIYYKNINSEKNPLPKDGNEDSSSGDKDPKDDKPGLIAAIGTIISNNKEIIITVTLGALVITAGFLVLNYYDIKLPSISNITNIFTDTNTNANTNINNNTIISTIVSSPSGITGQDYYMNYKQLYGDLPEEISIGQLTTNSLAASDFLSVLRKYPKETRDEVLLIIRDITNGVLTEELLLEYMPKHLNILHELLVLLYESKKN